MTLNKEKLEKIKEKIELLYPENSTKTYLSLKELMNKYSNSKIIIDKNKKYSSKIKSLKFSQKDSVLITYGDSIINKKINEKPLVTLNKFLDEHVKDKISCVHILPFFPYSSDDGFSIIDYKKVNPDLGDWNNVKSISKKYRLMADLVINHISSKSEWFQKFLKGDKKYKDYFIWFDKPVETSKVFRPRVHPLLTKFEVDWDTNTEQKNKNNSNKEHSNKKAKSTKYVWTTFSEDQIDLNFSNENVFLDMIEILLFYFSQGIEIIRLDAVGFLWKKLGTSCFHLKQTHEVVKVIRLISECLAPYSVVVTETNVPYKDNISYFGKSTNKTNDEAHMVYQFSFPPLVLDAFNRQDNKYLIELFKKNKKTNAKHPKGLFFNFLASHDGIGVLAGKEVLTKSEFELMINKVKENNGLISYKSLADGTKTPYELNISYLNAINNEVFINSNKDLAIQKFLASQAIILFSKGVPGIYIHSLLGSKNDIKGAKNSGINRRINREKLDFQKLDKELKDDKSFRNNIFKGYLQLIETRSMFKEFNPYANEKIVMLNTVKDKSEKYKEILVFERNFNKSKKLVILNLSKNNKIIKGLFGKDSKGNEKSLEVQPYDIIILK